MRIGVSWAANDTPIRINGEVRLPFYIEDHCIWTTALVSGILKNWCLGQIGCRSMNNKTRWTFTFRKRSVSVFGASVASHPLYIHQTRYDFSQQLHFNVHSGLILHFSRMSIDCIRWFGGARLLLGQLLLTCPGIPQSQHTRYPGDWFICGGLPDVIAFSPAEANLRLSRLRNGGATNGPWETV